MSEVKEEVEMDYTSTSRSRSPSRSSSFEESSVPGDHHRRTSSTSSSTTTSTNTSDMEDTTSEDVLDLSLPMRSRIVSGDSLVPSVNNSLVLYSGSNTNSDNGQGEKPSYKKSLLRRYCKWYSVL